MPIDPDASVAADPEKIDTSQLARQACQVVAGGLSKYPEGRRGELLDKWLQWGQSQQPRAQKQWDDLASDGFDRDRWVLDLWRSITAKDGTNHAIKQTMDTRVRWPVYQRHFFGWFLGRFNMQAALAVFLPRWFAVGLYFALPLTLAIASLEVLAAWDGSSASLLRRFGLLLAFLIVTGFVLWIPRFGLPLYAYFNFLIPRLAAAIGIGYLFLFSAPHLVKIINAHGASTTHLWLALALTLAALLYLMFHIHRRVHPPLKGRTLLWRSFSVLVLAIAYSALELLLAAPILFSKAFLCDNVASEKCAAYPDPYGLALCAAIALNLGVVLQLAWDEKPLTEPL